MQSQSHHCVCSLPDTLTNYVVVQVVNRTALSTKLLIFRRWCSLALVDLCFV